MGGVTDELTDRLGLGNGLLAGSSSVFALLGKKLIVGKLLGGRLGTVECAPKRMSGFLALGA